MARGAAGSIGVTLGWWNLPVGIGVKKANTSPQPRYQRRYAPRTVRLRIGTPRIDWPPGVRTPKIAKDPMHRGIPSSKEAQFAHCQNTRPAGLWATRCVRILLPQVGGARTAAFRGAGVPSRPVVLQLHGACARQLRPADRWRSFHRARRQRSSPSAVRGPVEAPPCIRQRAISPVLYRHTFLGKDCDRMRTINSCRNNGRVTPSAASAWKPPCG
jgi:hypothetical protein